MITLGLTGWSDHESIQRNRQKKLEEYASHFPVVELDTSFYAIPSQKNINQWVDKTPDIFTFIPKAYRVLTLHASFKDEFETIEEAFRIYKSAFSPMIEKNKVKAFLFQFPPTFNCVKKHVNYLRFIRKQMGNLPIAIEFRNPSWFSENNHQRTISFLRSLNFVNVIVDQPQTPHNSVPMVSEKTNDELVVFRFHGRNYEGWLGENLKDWRAERTLYNYSIEELNSFKELILERAEDANEVCIIFNNNSGGHAAPNAKQLQSLLGIAFEGLGPQQLDLL
jgi:uncharacterized protein YecE (DUF72 family)